MAARLNKRHSDDVRAKIKVGNIIARLQKHVDGEIEMTPSQVTSAKILLDKTISNAPTEVNSKIDGNMQITHVVHTIIDATDSKDTTSL
jgi:hypothetical protein